MLSILSKQSRLCAAFNVIKWIPRAHTTVGECAVPREVPYLQSLIWIPLCDWVALIPHTCSRGPLNGSRSADYLITASRTTYNIPLPDPLLCSPTLICLNKPGLILSQKYQPTIWTSYRAEGNLTSSLWSSWGQGLAHSRSCVDKCAAPGLKQLLYIALIYRILN